MGHRHTRGESPNPLRQDVHGAASASGAHVHLFVADHPAAADAKRSANTDDLYELIYEEDALTAVPFGPIEPVPWIGLTVRDNWLPTQLQANFIDLIHKRIVGSLMPTQQLKQGNSGARSQRTGSPAVTS